MDKFSLFILNIFVNSFLMFLTVAFLIEAIIFLFRIRQGRFAAILRMIPIVKLPLDLFLYDFTKWSYVHGVNPLTCEEGTRTLSVMCSWISSATDWLFLPITSSIQFTVPGNMTFTIADVIGQSMNSVFLNCFVVLFLLCSLSFMIKKLFEYILHPQARFANPAENRKIRNSSLRDSFKKGRLQIVTSSSLAGSPFVTGLTSPIVYISYSLSKNLSRKEYEAILAHEMEHIRYKDCFVRFILNCIGSLFWWVPTKWFLKRIEEGQEVGCDLKCKSYGVNPLDLASAICKSAKNSLKVSHPPFAHHLAKHPVQRRINLLLKDAPMRLRKTRFVFCFLAAGIALLVIFTGRFWIF